MNLILLHPEEIQQGNVRLLGRRLEHLRKVIRAKDGDTVRLGVLGSGIGNGLITAISRQEALITLHINSPPPPRPGVSLILALPRPIMLKRVLAQCAALGVDHLYLINSKRVEKSFFEASPVKDGDFGPFLANGLEQAMDTVAPMVSVHPRFRPFVEDVLPTLPQGQRLLAHPNGTTALSGLPPPSSPVLLAIGPEGGWLDYEVDSLARAGFQTVSLGPRILRVDTAVPAIIAQIGLLLDQGRRQGLSP